MSPRAGPLAGAALLACAAIAPAVLLQATDFDFVYGQDRGRQRALALLALAIPLALVLAAYGLGLAPRFAAAAERLAARWLALPRAGRVLALLGVFAASAAVALCILQLFPNSADEYAYLFQAETYAQGRLWIEPDPLLDVLHVMHAKVIDGKWVGRFPPGWPLFLAPWLSAGVPAWLVSPLLAAAALALLYTFGRRECGERAALVACAGVALSPFFLLNAGSYFSHVFAALLGLLFADAASRYLARPALGPALVAGLALGMLGLTRQLSAVLWFAPFAAAVLARRSLPHVVRLWPLAVAAALFLAALLLYNQAITGDPLVPPTVVNDPNQGLGFSGKHTPERALRFMERRVLLLSHYASPLFVALWVAGIARAARRRELRFWDAYFLLALAGYALYRNDSHNQYGPRYVFEAFPFMALRIGAAFAPARAEAWRPLAAGLILAWLAGTAANLPGTLALHRRIVWERTDPYRLAADAGLRDAVVFLASDSGVRQRMPTFDLVRNGLAADRRNVVFAHWREDRVPAVAARWPERTLWIYRREPGQVHGRLEPIARE